MKSRDAQVAVMVLKPGQCSSDDVENEHPRAEQWCFVAEGSGKARVGKRTVKLKAGSLLLIEKGEPHRVENTGKKDLVTINLYCPPAYAPSGEVSPKVATD